MVTLARLAVWVVETVVVVFSVVVIVVVEELAAPPPPSPPPPFWATATALSVEVETDDEVATCGIAVKSPHQVILPARRLVP